LNTHTSFCFFHSVHIQPSVSHIILRETATTRPLWSPRWQFGARTYPCTLVAAHRLNEASRNMYCQVVFNYCASMQPLSIMYVQESRLMLFPSCVCVCVCVCVCAPPPPNQLLNAWTNLYETWYVYHGNWAHLNGVLHKSHPSVCVSLILLLIKGSVKSIHPSAARQRLGKHVPVATNTRTNRRTVESLIFHAVHVLSKGSLWVYVFPCCWQATTR
jgi:hypothetical protein